MHKSGQEKPYQKLKWWRCFILTSRLPSLQASILDPFPVPTPRASNYRVFTKSLNHIIYKSLNNFFYIIYLSFDPTCLFEVDGTGSSPPASMLLALLAAAAVLRFVFHHLVRIVCRRQRFQGSDRRGVVGGGGLAPVAQALRLTDDVVKIGLGQRTRLKREWRRVWNWFLGLSAQGRQKHVLITRVSLSAIRNRTSLLAFGCSN
jgi:hypothetical protein